MLKSLTPKTKLSSGHDQKKYMNKFWCFDHIERRKKEIKCQLYVILIHRKKGSQ